MLATDDGHGCRRPRSSRGSLIPEEETPRGRPPRGLPRHPTAHPRSGAGASSQLPLTARISSDFLRGLRHLPSPGHGGPPLTIGCWPPSPPLRPRRSTPSVPGRHDIHSQPRALRWGSPATKLSPHTVKQPAPQCQLRHLGPTSDCRGSPGPWGHQGWGPQVQRSCSQSTLPLCTRPTRTGVSPPPLHGGVASAWNPPRRVTGARNVRTHTSSPKRPVRVRSRGKPRGLRK